MHSTVNPSLKSDPIFFRYFDFATPEGMKLLKETFAKWLFLLQCIDKRIHGDFLIIKFYYSFLIGSCNSFTLIEYIHKFCLTRHTFILLSSLESNSFKAARSPRSQKSVTICYAISNLLLVEPMYLCNRIAIPYRRNASWLYYSIFQLSSIHLSILLIFRKSTWKLECRAALSTMQ